MSKAHIVYIADFGQYAKIGITRLHLLDGRLRTIQTGHPYRLRKCSFMRSPSRVASRKLENNLHRRLRKHRKHGEWFSNHLIFRAKLWLFTGFRRIEQKNLTR